jgi:hypothetical protein
MKTSDAQGLIEALDMKDVMRAHEANLKRA